MSALLCPPALAGEIAPSKPSCPPAGAAGSQRPAPALDFLKLSPLGLEVLRALNEAFDEAAAMAAVSADTFTDTITGFCRGE
jgi:hypothetical protein